MCWLVLLSAGLWCWVAGQLKDTVHGQGRSGHSVYIGSPNHYYLEYSKLLYNQNTAPGGVYLKHPALPLHTRGRVTPEAKEGVVEGCGLRGHGGMTPGQVSMMCDMYKAWGRSMKQDMQWRPSQSQTTWWSSLGMEGRLNQGDLDKPRKVKRREYRMLSDSERGRFHHALNVLKRTYMGRESKYDMFVRYHQAALSPGAHFGPAFYGWHRELLLRLEHALQEVDPSVSLPYWDSNLDHHLGDALAQQSVLWTHHFLGNGHGDVISGPFAYWSMPYPINGRTQLHRNLTVAPSRARREPSLMSEEAIKTVLSAKSFRELTWFINMEFESHHGALHNWVGGSMASLPQSPADPIFFLHHAFVDCLWEQSRNNIRRSHPHLDPQYMYPNDSEALGVGMVQPDGTMLQKPEDSYHYSLSPMHPFAPMTNIEGLKNHYTEQFYSCEASPVCSAQEPHCGSRYLFCDVDTFRCAPKLQKGALCSKFKNSDPCFEGLCCYGKCEPTCGEEENGDFKQVNYGNDEQGKTKIVNVHKEQTLDNTNGDLGSGKESSNNRQKTNIQRYENNAVKASKPEQYVRSGIVLHSQSFHKPKSLSGNRDKPQYKVHTNTHPGRSYIPTSDHRPSDRLRSARPPYPGIRLPYRDTVAGETVHDNIIETFLRKPSPHFLQSDPKWRQLVHGPNLGQGVSVEQVPDTWGRRAHAQSHLSRELTGFHISRPRNSGRAVFPSNAFFPVARRFKKHVTRRSL